MALGAAFRVSERFNLCLPALAHNGPGGCFSPGRPAGKAVDFANLFNPMPALGVFERKKILVRPVKVIGDISYLLVKLREGIAYDSPGRSGSTSNACWQCGQATFITLVPFALMRL